MVQARTDEPWTDDSLATLTANRDSLVSRCGFSEDHITMRCDPDREALHAACCDLAVRTGDPPAFFLFVGPGFDGNDTWIGSTLSQAHWTMSLTDVTAYLSPARDLTAAVFGDLSEEPRTAKR